MRLGLYHEPVHTDGRTFDTYGPYARYILEFAKHFDHVTVFAPTTDQPTYFSGTAIDADNVTVVPLPFFTTHAQAYARSPAIAMAFHRHCRDLDVINCRGTAPLGYVLWYLTRRQKAPFLYHFASDPFEVLTNSPKYQGVRGIVARLGYGAEFQIQKMIMQRNYSFTSGQAIYERLRRYTSRVEPLITSSLQEEDYYRRDDTCTSLPVKLLFVGHLRREKGVNDIIEAVRLLRKQGRNVELDIIGDGAYKNELAACVRRSEQEAVIHFRGYAVMGPQLNANFNSSDIFVFPSLSEGSPKVVLEAMAHSLPVVATPVGNIPEMLNDGQRGVLVPIQNPQTLAEGIARIMDDRDYRQTCIRESFLFARSHGLVNFVARMADKMREMVLERRGGK